MAGLHLEELSVEWSNLEGFGGAQIIPVWLENIVAAGADAIMVDNYGFIWAQAKGCSRDEYIYTLAKYII